MSTLVYRIYIQINKTRVIETVWEQSIKKSVLKQNTVFKTYNKLTDG